MKIPGLTLPPVRKDALTRLIALALSGRAMSRSEWANRTGVSLTTTGKVARALLAAGVITEQVPTQFRSGRKTGILRANQSCRFLAASVERESCLLTVRDGWGVVQNERRMPYLEDLTEEENRLLWRDAFKQWKNRLEDTGFLVGSVLTAPEVVLEHREKKDFLATWEADCLLSREEGVKKMILGCFGAEAVYFVSLESDLHPMLYVEGRELAGNPILAKDHPRRSEQLRCMIERWNAMKQIFPDPRLILWAKNVSPAEDEILRRKLLSEKDESILYSSNLELEGSLYCLRINMAEAIVCDKRG